MMAVLSKSVLERHQRENEVLVSALRAQAKQLLKQIECEKGEVNLFLSECIGAGFYMLFERVYVAVSHQRSDLWREILSAATDVDGYARLVLRLEEMKGVNV